MNRSSSSRLFPFVSTLTLAFAVTACTGDDGAADEHDHDDHDHDTETGDGDGDAQTIAVTLRFAAAVGDQDAACGVVYDGIGSAATTVEIQDFRFYVHGIELIDADGGATPLTLEQDGLWQYQDLALLDFEDGTGACQDAGTAELNDVVVGTAPAGDYTGVRFVLGVPFELNHLDVDSAPSPLNVPSMFWAWQGGYKFARIDLDNGNVDDPSWFWHQGSTGCESGGPMEPPPEECARPNRLPIELPAFDVETNVIVLDVATLLDGVDVSQNTPTTSPGCMSAPTDPECVALFPNLGLSLETGACTGDCSEQQVFRVE